MQLRLERLRTFMSLMNLLCFLSRDGLSILSWRQDNQQSVNTYRQQLNFGTLIDFGSST